MKRIISTCALIASLTAVADEKSSNDIIFINEDWYGHNNSSINILHPDVESGEYWSYRAFQEANPGCQLGCTAQSGQIWGDRLYIISKQAKDPGADIEGGRITVADAITLKLLHQQPLIDASGERCDGRSFVGFDAHKGYISTSNGVWGFNLDTYTVTGRVEGTENPDGDALYRGQSGAMVVAEGRLFAAHQSNGLLVIDTETEKVTDCISMDVVKEGAGIGSIVKAKDGSLWVSVAAGKTGVGTTLPYLLKINPSSLDIEIVDLGDNFAPSNSWHSWTPDTFCASTLTNRLFWSGGANSWFSGSDVYCMDIDTREIRHIIDFNAEGEKWKVYGCSMRVDPRTDHLYMSLYHEPNLPTYIVRLCDADGKKLRDYEMISHYWFPSLPVWPTAIDDEKGIVDNVALAPEVVNTEFYNLNGLRITSPIGISIKRETLSDGSIRISKTVSH